MNTGMAVVSRKQNSSAHLFQRFTGKIEQNRFLREPQRDAYTAIRTHFEFHNESVVVQIPVGCGKTGLMSVLPFGIANGRVLIVAPNVTIRDAIFEAVDSASETCFWRAVGAATPTREGPFAAKIDGPRATLADCVNSHFIVTNVQQMGTAKSRWLQSLPADFVDMILIDEGHHNAAASWRRLMDHFPMAKIVSLTATPFRSDGKRVIGMPVYSYPFLRAMARGYIKPLRAIHVAPCELSFTFQDDTRECTLEEVLTLREETWFSRGVALSEECNRNIVSASIAECKRHRASKGTKHQIIAAACSVEHAGQIATLYREAGYHAEAIHSGQPQRQRENVLQRLKSGRLDAIVQVQMLGEGFDHPPLSVAAVFRPFRTLSPYVQFIGRIMRVMRQNRPGDADNWGGVVSHVGLNTERHWDEFRQLDEADQQLWAGLTGGEEPKIPQNQGDTEAREPRTFSPEMLVAWEVMGELQKSGFGNAETTGEQLQLDFKGPEGQLQGAYAGPQQRRREARSRLQQHANDAIRDILYSSRLSALGWQIGHNFRFLRRQNNWAALRLWLYSELNKELARRPGGEWTLEEVETGIERVGVVRGRIEQSIAQTIRRKPSWPRYDRYSNT